MNRELPAGLRIIRTAEMALKGRPLPTVFEIDRFFISLEHLTRVFAAEELTSKLQQTFQGGECIFIKESKKGAKRVNVLPYLERLQVVKRETYASSVLIEDGIPSIKDLFNADFLVEMGVKKEGGVRSTAILQLILKLTAEEAGLLRVVKVKSLPPLW
jgi:hypothetical protein